MVLGTFAVLPATGADDATDTTAIEVSENANDSDISTFATEPETDESTPLQSETLENLGDDKRNDVTNKNVSPMVANSFMPVAFSDSSLSLSNDYVYFVNTGNWANPYCHY